MKNYTGDVMNFEMAAEMAEDMDGIKVAQVVTNDDVAVKDSLYTIGRRGVAGTVFVHKIAGALAEEGASLEQVQAMAQRVIDNVRTMGAAIAPCTVPAAGTPGFTLGEGEMEVGIGIHGEPGTHREPMRPADEVVDLLLEQKMCIRDSHFIVWRLFSNFQAGIDSAHSDRGVGQPHIYKLLFLNKI